MNNFSRFLTTLLILLVLPLIMLSYLPSAQAYDSTKIILPGVSDRSGYNNPALNAALQNKLRSQFRFPKYETSLTAPLTVAPDRTSLEKITADQSADGAVVVEVNFLQNRMITSLFDDESYEETNLTLTLTYFDKKAGQYGSFKANRSVTLLSSVDSGPLPLAVEALEELLNRLDAVFPRQFPGPRY
ncbi:MAG TPA: hypothetical protein VN631_04460 [Negativicutes bacterium]|nr:hypothetical protein [Negativicutes bacterium]